MAKCHCNLQCKQMLSSIFIIFHTFKLSQKFCCHCSSSVISYQSSCYSSSTVIAVQLLQQSIASKVHIVKRSSGKGKSLNLRDYGPGEVDRGKRRCVGSIQVTLGSLQVTVGHCRSLQVNVGHPRVTSGNHRLNIGLFRLTPGHLIGYWSTQGW